MHPWPEREDNDDVRIAAVHVTVVLTDGTVDTLVIPHGEATDFLSTAVTRDISFDQHNRAALVTLRCDIRTAFRMGVSKEPFYKLHRVRPDGSWQTPAGAVRAEHT